MKQLLTLLILLITIGCQSQENEKFNLGFEIKKEGNDLSEGWMKWGNYGLTIAPLDNIACKKTQII